MALRRRQKQFGGTKLINATNQNGQMNPSFKKPCSCGGENPTCFKCDGTGLIEEATQPLPTKFSKRGIPKAGESSPEDIRRRALEQKALQTPKISKQNPNAFLESSQSADSRRPTSKPKYRCVKCSYKWNIDPKARCAWCNELGPYQVHFEKLG